MQQEQQQRANETTTAAAPSRYSLTEIAEATADRLANAVAPRNLDDVERLAKKAADARLFGCTSVAVRVCCRRHLLVRPLVFDEPFCSGDNFLSVQADKLYRSVVNGFGALRHFPEDKNRFAERRPFFLYAP